MQRRIVILFALGLALTVVAPVASASQGAAGSYIVVLKDSVDRPGAIASEHAKAFGADVKFVYRHALNGYAAKLPAAAVTALQNDSRVAWVERDGTAYATATQTNPPWGLDRIDQRSLPLSGSFTYTRTGYGVKAYIIDTGIRMTHADFSGRAINGYDSIDGGAATDCNGHGTHVAGTVGGERYGVAKDVTLVAVRVLDCNGSGSWSSVIAGVDWVTGNHLAGQPAVANMSLGGGASSSVDTAVNNSINDGVSYAVAAGNGDIFGNQANACNYSPARVAAAMTISATNSSDYKASWANYGSCVDWFAPGVSITSAWHTSDTATNTISGTSMATPHTAGVAAQYLQGNYQSPSTVRNYLYNLTTKSVVRNSSTTNNHLLYTNL